MLQHVYTVLQAQRVLNISLSRYIYLLFYTRFMHKYICWDTKVLSPHPITNYVMYSQLISHLHHQILPLERIKSVRYCQAYCNTVKSMRYSSLIPKLYKNANARNNWYSEVWFLHPWARSELQAEWAKSEGCQHWACDSCWWWRDICMSNGNGWPPLLCTIQCTQHLPKKFKNSGHLLSTVHAVNYQTFI